MSPPLDRLPTVPCSAAAAPRQHAVRRNPLSSVQLLLLHGSESRRSARHSSQSPLCLNHQGLDLLLEPLQVLDDQDRGGDSGLPNDRILGHVVLVQEPQLGLSSLNYQATRFEALGLRMDDFAYCDSSLDNCSNPSLFLLNSCICGYLLPLSSALR
ncbi:hypothetical protein BHE74_00006517 [Ensete ventricosum]|nr:hypothetical protein GW17_00023727 [Ensete ventricosum]RWW84849.1 hypothetical protein BHE74_00006517 [Ensete ventricosum]RZR86264.1 hypothetical protein BHM03_00013434 [Ensete ventricosum]